MKITFSHYTHKKSERNPLASLWPSQIHICLFMKTKPKDRSNKVSDKISRETPAWNKRVSWSKSFTLIGNYVSREMVTKQNFPKAILLQSWSLSQ